MGKYYQTVQSFFHSGVVNQKSPDIVINLKRIGEEKLSKWSKAEKKEALKWMKMCNKVFTAFEKEIQDSLKQIK